MQSLRHALANYIESLEAGSSRTHRAEERGLYQQHLAVAALMFVAIENQTSIAKVRELVASERRSYGWSFLEGPEGKAVETAFNEFAKLVENAT